MLQSLQAAKCKRLDWEQGNLTREEKSLRRFVLERIKPDIYLNFINLSPRPTIEELETVSRPICYTSFDALYGDKYDENEKMERSVREQ